MSDNKSNRSGRGRGGKWRPRKFPGPWSRSKNLEQPSDDGNNQVAGGSGKQDDQPEKVACTTSKTVPGRMITKKNQEIQEKDGPEEPKVNCPSDKGTKSFTFYNKNKKPEKVVYTTSQRVPKGRKITKRNQVIQEKDGPEDPKVNCPSDKDTKRSTFDNRNKDDTCFSENGDAQQNGHVSLIHQEDESNSAKVDQEIALKMSNLALNSKLSPYAAEFYPRGYQHQCSTSEIQVKIDSATEKKPVVKAVIPLSDEQVLQNLMLELEDTLQFCCTKILENPGCFDDVMEVVKSHFVQYLKYGSLAVKTVDCLYCLTNSSPGFSYHAVRLLDYLISLEWSEYETILMRNALLGFLQEKYYMFHRVLTIHEKEEMGIFTILCYLLFMGELYIQLEIGGRRIFFLGNFISGIVEKFLVAEEYSAKERFVNIVNVLKLTGSYMDKDNTDLLDQLIPLLELQLENDKHNLDENTILSVKEFIAYRNSNWRSENEAEKPTEAQPNAPSQIEVPQQVKPDGAQEQAEANLPDNAVMYGPDGAIMGSEEELFLNCNVQNEIGWDQQSQASPGSMDSDMQEAYAEFLQSLPVKESFD